jgi:CheY-like chemotaxis protein
LIELTKSVRALLVEDNHDHAYLLQEMLTEAGVTKGNIECVDRLSKAFEQLRKRGFEFVLLDLG